MGLALAWDPGPARSPLDCSRCSWSRTCASWPTSSASTTGRAAGRTSTTRTRSIAPSSRAACRGRRWACSPRPSESSASVLSRASCPGRARSWRRRSSGLSLVYSHPLVGGKGLPGASSLLHLAGGGPPFSAGVRRGAAHRLRRAPAEPLLRPRLRGGPSQPGGRRPRRRPSSRSAEPPPCDSARDGCSSRASCSSRLSVGLVVGLGLDGIAPPLLAVTAAALYPLHGLFFWGALREGLTFRAVDRYRTRYRLLYALVGLAVALSVVWRI